MPKIWIKSKKKPVTFLQLNQINKKESVRKECI